MGVLYVGKKRATFLWSGIVDAVKKYLPPKYANAEIILLIFGIFVWTLRLGGIFLKLNFSFPFSYNAMWFGCDFEMCMRKRQFPKWIGVAWDNLCF